MERNRADSSSLVWDKGLEAALEADKRECNGIRATFRYVCPVSRSRSMAACGMAASQATSDLDLRPSQSSRTWSTARVPSPSTSHADTTSVPASSHNLASHATSGP